MLSPHVYPFHIHGKYRTFLFQSISQKAIALSFACLPALQPFISHPCVPAANGKANHELLDIPIPAVGAQLLLCSLRPEH
jgi:hypothetical protein